MDYIELDKKINDKKELEDAITVVCAKCFENLQINCEGCPVVEIEAIVEGK